MVHRVWRAHRAGAATSPTPRLPPRRGGFTLVEIMVVLAVLGIVSAVGFSHLVPALERAKIGRVTTILAADLQYAQMVAVRRRQPVVVLINPSLKFYVVRDRPGTTVYRQRFVGPDTDYGVETLTASPTTSIEIFPTGVTPQTITFRVGLSDYEREVRLSRAGQIRVLPLVVIGG